ncbi:uncharacterized protein LOC116289567 [Actinia tenebrosa]|uniref:Uncharacterized protein LOC116289567 n=1 Tax=Actinia tenebrosa TaxID=6105 RepID=A0A6P8HIH4_ACTTE|nr:uncharacterized protein LOC116289567 [Actinia tenebrosa]
MSLYSRHRCSPVLKSLDATEGDAVTFVWDLISPGTGKIDRLEWGIWINPTRWYPCIVLTRKYPPKHDSKIVCKSLYSRMKPPTKENLEQGISAMVLLNFTNEDPKNFYTDVQLEGRYNKEDPIIYQVKVSPRSVTVNPTAKSVTTKPNSATTKSDLKIVVLIAPLVCFALLALA